jgi:hypothetical protein
LYGFTRRRLRKIRHRVSCGIPSSRLALSVAFRGLHWKASLPQTLHSPPKGPVVLGVLRCTGTTRNSGIFYTTAWRCSSSACSCRTWSYNFAAQVQLTAFVRTPAHKKPPLTQSAPFSPSLLTWRPATKLSVYDMHKQTWRVLPPISEAHVQDLSVIQVYQFCEICR